jgi:hypothetical protein
MNFFRTKKRFAPAFVLLCACAPMSIFAQTDNDGIMMNKHQWCNGAEYMHSQWTNYWEGTLKRNNLNLGTVSTQSVMVMSNFGITNNLNVIASVPYIWTKASAGTLHGMKGFQDASLFLKWRAITVPVAKGKLSLFAVGGISTPTHNYVIDFLPLSIGLGSTNLTGRITADYQKGIFYATLSGAYVWRSNVKLDRTSYYTTEMHYTNVVQMPDMLNFNFDFGIRKKYLVAEANVLNMTTLGGFDMRRNDMPFVSNRMNSTSIGLHAKYTLPFFSHLELVAGGGYVIGGVKIGQQNILQPRNVGQSTSLHVGGYYIFTFKSKSSIKK